MDVKFINNKLQQLDAHYKHPSYFLEKRLVRAITYCLKDEAIETLNTINSMERAILSKDSLRSLKNSLIASCTLFSRAAIDANVQPEDAFAMSDSLILHLESLYHVEDVKMHEYHMVNQFIELIHESRVANYSNQVADIVAFINANITSAITLSDVADHMRYSKEYLSRLFKKEMDISIGDYIHQQKAEVSKLFLEHSDMAIHDIAIMFNYCNSSYYSKMFKASQHMTPKQFRFNKNATD